MKLSSVLPLEWSRWGDDWGWWMFLFVFLYILEGKDGFHPFWFLLLFRTFRDPFRIIFVCVNHSLSVSISWLGMYPLLDWHIAERTCPLGLLHAREPFVFSLSCNDCNTFWFIFPKTLVRCSFNDVCLYPNNWSILLECIFWSHYFVIFSLFNILLALVYK